MTHFGGHHPETSPASATPIRGSLMDGPSIMETRTTASAQQLITSSGQPVERFVLVHPSRLFRDCLTWALTSRLRCSVIEFQSAADAVANGSFDGLSMLLYNVSCEATSSETLHLDTLLHEIDGRVPIVVTGDSEDPELIRQFLEKGIRGYIPMSLGLEVVIHALLLVKAGGIFAPASCLMNINRTLASKTEDTGELDILTAKQLAVVRAIRQGKPNKTIAYELNMCESTVKVHVRNIMKKLRARNRTQVAFIANQFLEEHQAA
jgi:DNA-binding NarL/FixJ family response regulator